MFFLTADTRARRCVVDWCLWPGSQTTPLYTSRWRIILNAIWSAPPTAALWLFSGAVGARGCSSRTVSCEESQSGGVAAALQISMMAEYHLKAPPRYTLPIVYKGVV